MLVLNWILLVPKSRIGIGMVVNAICLLYMKMRVGELLKWLGWSVLHGRPVSHPYPISYVKVPYKYHSTFSSPSHTKIINLRLFLYGQIIVVLNLLL